MKAMNKTEEMVLEMLAKGEKLHGFARDILIEMKLREMEEQANTVKEVQ